MIDALNPAGDSAMQMMAGDALLTNCPESHPMWQAEIVSSITLDVKPCITSSQLAGNW